MVDVRLQAPCKPTEVSDRVATAMQNLVPDAEVDFADHVATGVGHDVTRLRQRVWELRIIDAFRSALLAGQGTDEVKVVVSKQAALGGQVRLPAGTSALGDIEMTFRLTAQDPWDAEGFIWWMCPETEDGEIVGPKD